MSRTDYHDEHGNYKGWSETTPDPNGGGGWVIGGIIMLLVLALILNKCVDLDSESDYEEHELNGSDSSEISEFKYENNAILFDLPIVCEKNTANSISFRKEAEDIKGYSHRNCYQLIGTERERYIGFGLNGNYKTLSGSLYSTNDENDEDVVWLDFYDGETLIYTTQKISRVVYSTQFCIDISGVQNLIVHFRSNSSNNLSGMIAESFVLSKENASNSTKANSFELFDFPVSDVYDRGLDIALWPSTTDINDKVHLNKYEVHADVNAFAHYALDGKYKTLSGALYYDSGSNYGDGYEKVWFEFYDGETLLFATEKLNDVNYSTSFSVDIRNVKYLTVYCKMADHTGSWAYHSASVIVDHLTASK